VFGFILNFEFDVFDIFLNDAFSLVAS
jgi:hypothetical protein